MIYAVKKNFAEDYITMNPDGINVPLTNDVASATVHFTVSARQASKPNPERRQVDKNVLMHIAINVQHYELRQLAQYVKPIDRHCRRLGRARLRPSQPALGSEQDHQ